MHVRWSGETKYQALLAVTQAASSRRDVSSVMDAVAGALEKLVRVDMIGVVRREGAGLRPLGAYFRGAPRRTGEPHGSYLDRMSQAVHIQENIDEQSIVRQTVERDRQTLVLNEVTKDPRLEGNVVRNLGVECAVVMPMTMDDEFVGSLVFGRTSATRLHRYLIHPWIVVPADKKWFALTSWSWASGTRCSVRWIRAGAPDRFGGLLREPAPHEHIERFRAADHGAVVASAEQVVAYPVPFREPRRACETRLRVERVRRCDHFRVLDIEGRAGQNLAEEPGAAGEDAGRCGPYQRGHLPGRDDVEGALQNQQVDRLVPQCERQVVGDLGAGPVAFVQDRPTALGAPASFNVAYGNHARSSNWRGKAKTPRCLQVGRG